LKKLLEQDESTPIRGLCIDFDQQKDVVKAFKAIKQSTLIVFKGGKEIDKSLGVTSEQDGIVKGRLHGCRKTFSYCWAGYQSGPGCFP
jgi:hypothetical protein